MDTSKLGLALRVAVPPADFADKVGLSLDELRFVVIVEDVFLKRSTVVFEAELSALSGNDIELPEVAAQASTWHGETRIHFAVVLRADRVAEPAVARREASWVARKRFRIATPVNAATFPIEPVDPDWFERHRLPGNTAYWIDLVDPDLNQATTEMSSLVKVRMNRAVVAALQNERESAASIAMIRSVYVDVVTTVLTTGLGVLKDEMPAEGSILDTALTKLAKDTTIPYERIVDLARIPGGGELRAVVQAQVQLGQSMIAAVKRKGS